MVSWPVTVVDDEWRVTVYDGQLIFRMFCGGRACGLACTDEYSSHPWRVRYLTDYGTNVAFYHTWSGVKDDLGWVIILLSIQWCRSGIVIALVCPRTAFWGRRYDPLNIFEYNIKLVILSSAPNPLDEPSGGSVRWSSNNQTCGLNRWAHSYILSGFWIVKSKLMPLLGSNGEHALVRHHKS